MVHNVGCTTGGPSESEVVPPSYGLRSGEAPGFWNKRVTENECRQECAVATRADGVFQRLTRAFPDTGDWESAHYVFPRRGSEEVCDERRKPGVRSVKGPRWSGHGQHRNSISVGRPPIHTPAHSRSEGAKTRPKGSGLL
jgi:hypothetical protein